MDGDSGDEGNDELKCVRSDKSDKSSWSAADSRQAKSLFGKLRQGDAWWKEQLLTFREEEEARWARGGYDSLTDYYTVMYVSLQRVQWNQLCFGLGKPVYKSNLVLETLSTIIRWPDWSRVPKWLRHFGPWSIRSLVTSDLY